MIKVQWEKCFVRETNAKHLMVWVFVKGRKRAVFSTSIKLPF